MDVIIVWKEYNNVTKTNGGLTMINKVLELLKTNEPMRPGQVADALGADRKEVDKAIKVLRKEEQIYSPKRCFYTAD